MHTVRLFVRLLPKELSIINNVAYSTQHAPTKLRKKYYRRSTGQPGIDLQAKVLDYSAEELQELDDLDDNELNMSLSGELYDEHNRELEHQDQRRGLAMYAQKYYKEPKEPYLLSSADIQQIRHLHSKENWPVEELARSFPASERIILKVLKSAWKPDFQTKQRQDEKVAKNWELLTKGKLQISDDLRRHCLKFTNRRVFPSNVKDVAIPEQPDTRVKGAFYSLLGRPEEVTDNKEEEKRKEEEENQKDEEEKERNREEFGSDKKSLSPPPRVFYKLRKKLVTLEEARKIELMSIAAGNEVDDKGKAFVYGDATAAFVASSDNQVKADQESRVKHEPSIATKVTKTSNVYPSRWGSSGRSSDAAKDMMTAPYDDYPDRITIPESVRKKDALYRVEDCFYDENGDFLYRVPGLKL